MPKSKYNNTNAVIVRLDRTIHRFLDSPIKSGNDDYSW
jgi:hypothetical protein